MSVCGEYRRRYNPELVVCDVYHVSNKGLLRGYAGGERVYLWDEQRADGNQSAVDEILGSESLSRMVQSESEGERMITIFLIWLVTVLASHDYED